MAIAQVHRFHDAVAVFIGKGETVYLTHDQAQQLGRALIDCAADVWAKPFLKCSFDTAMVGIGNSEQNKRAKIDRT